MIAYARTALASALAVVAFTASVSAAPICLRSNQIRSTSSPDAHTLLFKMDDGTVWRNTLHNACPGLKFWGFVYNVRGGPDEVCENVQAIHVINTGEACVLGAFTRDSSPPHA